MAATRSVPEQDDFAPPAPSPKPSTTMALWRSVIALDRAKVNSAALAVRNSLGVAIPLAVGIALEEAAAGGAVASGALNVAFSDGTDPYAHRARRMLAWSFLGAFAVFSGSASGEYPALSITLTIAWAFLAGLLVSISQRAADLGLNTLVALIVFAARVPTSAGGAVAVALLVLGGGLLQTTFTLVLWPVHRHEPERRAVGSTYLDLAAAIQSTEEGALADPLSTTPSTDVQEILTALGRDRSIEGERFRLLFDQADRIRLSAFLLRRLQSQLAYQSMSQSSQDAKRQEAAIAGMDAIFDNAAALLQEVSANLISGAPHPNLDGLMKKADALAAESGANLEEHDPLAKEIGGAIDTLTGQLRGVGRLASRSTLEGEAQFQSREDATPFHLQVKGWGETLRANLTFRSSAFRHAVRLAVFVALAETISHSISWQRPYWLPMTVAVILRPDFTTTFSRGALRLTGTLTGLLIATALYHVVPATALPELVMVTIFMFFLRMFGPANYGVFSVAITGLIVFLVATLGTPPGQVVVQRGLNTVAGGLLALLAYGIWPTWERRRVSDVMAELLDGTRLYFRAVMDEFHGGGDGEAGASIAEKARQDWRRARSNAEASVDRVSSEPRITAEKLSCLHSMLATSYAVAHAIMSLEAGLGQPARYQDSKEFRTFAHDLELTFYFLAATLRGSAGASGALPKLREDHSKLVKASGVHDMEADFILLQSDRLVVAVNTLREQVVRFTN